MRARWVSYTRGPDTTIVDDAPASGTSAATPRILPPCAQIEVCCFSPTNLTPLIVI